MRVLLVYLRYEGDVYMDSYEQDHLGMGYLASSLRTAGHEVEMVNGHWLGLSLAELIEVVDAKDFDLVGIPVHVETLYDLKRFTEYLGRRKTPIALGGHWPSLEPKAVLNLLPDADFVIMGEGEVTFPDLLDRLERGGDVDSVKGLAFRRDGDVVVTAPRPLIRDLDAIPWPARDDLRVYNTPAWSFKKRTANMLASRGCYAFCSYCSIVAMYAKSPGRAVRARSPEKVVDEIEHLVESYRVNQIFFGDDNFRGPDKTQPGWSDEVAREILRRGLDVRFIFMCRVDDVERKSFELLKRAGLVGVAMGIESDVDRMLDSFNKRSSKQDNRRALSILRDLRIDPLISFIMFDPYTKTSEIRENLRFFREIDYVRYCHYTRPLTLLGGYDLKTYGGTNYTQTVGDDGYRRESDFAYECDFEHAGTAAVFDLIQQWRVNILELIMHNPLWMIDMAHRLGREDLAYRTHGLARKYTKQDMRLFEEIVDLVDAGHGADSSPGADLLEKYRREARVISRKLTAIQTELDETHRHRIASTPELSARA